ncbi:hypothetical protein DFP72DRAFT_986334 [Ephemerocybe angulata]|uniref:Ketoreductase domain-containing protein n=1 Tax=Ephemerocybe angulata TaxID=980116 RepID=A0A8H6IEX4_9AGAR|nr:hypothetical protein DFP72DRAFT_986334 [Tulosesus angulatus]
MDPPSTLPALDLFSLKGQNALITGATRGIGAACALALAEAGASVCLVQRHPTLGSEPNLETYNTIKAYLADKGADQVVELVHCDLDKFDEVKALFAQALEIMPRKEIDILVNCAGIQRRAPAVDFSEQDWDDVLNTNLKSVWLLAQSAGRHMVPRRHGKIINFCSLLTFQGGLTVPAYAAAKGALGQLTKALANEWSKENVQVNAICPGYIKTDMNERLLADATRLRQISERIPAGRWGEPKDFAGPLVFLSSNASQYVCGELGWMGR